MIHVILFFSLLIAFCVIGFIVLIVAIKREEKKEQKRRENAFRCKQAVRSGDCPKDCSMCEWGGYEN